MTARGKQSVLTVLSDAGMSAETLSSIVLGNWFMPFLPLSDALLVTAATIIGGTGTAARVLATILEKISIEATQRGVEGIVPGAFTSDFSFKLCIFEIML